MEGGKTSESAIELIEYQKKPKDCKNGKVALLAPWVSEDGCTGAS